MSEPQAREGVAAKSSRPMAAGHVLGLYGFFVLSAVVLGLCVAVAYAAFVKTCQMMGSGDMGSVPSATYW